ncbi:MAG: DNA mismatch repair endonuclease MutH [Polyangiaceae bacterium]|nr:DNA mismatch repair endonuclease MutH [Polyangiaceae bacterium]
MRGASAPPPETEGELLARAQSLAGRTLAELAAELGLAVPPDLRRAKGWVGQLVERALGACAASRPGPDFAALGVELKTLPLDRHGRPCETTFVCNVPMRAVSELSWGDSPLRHKLARVLWVPVEGERQLPVGARHVGAPLLWSPSAEEEAVLASDWEELAGIIGRGGIESLTARVGRAVQVRPKAAHGRVRRRSLDAEGTSIDALPRGFYLRVSFTEAIVRRSYAAPAQRRGDRAPR